MTTLSPPSVPDVQPKETSRPNRWWRFLRWWFRHWKLSLCLLALAGIGVGVLWLKSTSSTDTPLLSVERTAAIERGGAPNPRHWAMGVAFSGH